jgi:hypothetical protein
MIFHRTPYQRSNSEHEHLIASMQPRKYSKKNFKTEFQKKPKTTLEVLKEPAVLSYEELGGLSDPGLRDCVHNVVQTGLEDRNKRLISINKPAKAPNHRVLSTGATERYVFRSRIENPPSVLEYIYDQILLPKILCISFV